MKAVVAPLALLAMAPAMLGSAALAQARTMTVALCGGGTASIPLNGSVPAGGENAPCCAKGCHSGSSRKRVDKSQ
jgi:hypothetical protein